MSVRFEAFLAKLYVDAAARSLFLANPRRSATEAGLNAHEVEAAEKIDRLGLQMAANSLHRKQQAKQEHRDGHR
jgi:hypothetical protein